jgi:S1-C subfamily serine protease
VRAYRPGTRPLLPGLLALLAAAAAPGAGAAPGYEAQVVALRVTYQEFQEDRPWAKERPDVRTGSAVAVAGPRLLTEAAMIRDATLIQVEKRNSAARFAARVAHVDHEIDLALLAVDDPAFFDDLVPARLASAVPTEGFVSSVRWNNRQLEVSNSRVARIEVRKSPYGSVHHAFLLVTTDLTGGGWSEPVFLGERLIGLTASQSDKFASVIPAEVLARYLSEAVRPGYRGFASFAMTWQPNQDRALARYLGLTGPPRGVVVGEVPWGSSACGALEPRDVLLALEGREIDALGNYRHPHYGQIALEHLAVDGHRPGDVLRARVLRGGELREIALPLRRYPAGAPLVPWRRDEEPPPYLVAGGLVFRELDGRYLLSFGGDWRKKAPFRLVHLHDAEGQAQAKGRRRIVILSRVLPAALNLGYHDLADLAVREINGRAIDSLAGVEEALQDPREGFHQVVFQPNEERAELVLDGRGFEAASARILEEYGVTAALRRPAAPPPDLGPECRGGV